MKKMRKIFAVLLTLAMVLTMSMTAFAAANSGNDGIFGTADDTATITVTGIDNETGRSRISGRQWSTHNRRWLL